MNKTTRKYVEIKIYIKSCDDKFFYTFTPDNDDSWIEISEEVYEGMKNG